MEHKGGIEIYADKRPAWIRGGVEIRAVNNDNNTYASDFVWNPITPGCHMPVLTVIHDTYAQSLMDQLWNCGLRPTEGSGSAGALAATERHLKDLQLLLAGFMQRERNQNING